MLAGPVVPARIVGIPGQFLEFHDVLLAFAADTESLVEIAALLGFRRLGLLLLCLGLLGQLERVNAGVLHSPLIALGLIDNNSWSIIAPASVYTRQIR